jgi:DNA-3-methyladenine glycosylase II
MSPQEVSKAIRFLKKDKDLELVIKSVPKFEAKTVTINEVEVFDSLVRSIIFQQLSGKVASAILTRFKGLFTEKKPTPRKVLNLKDEKFKSAGVSPQKAGYLRDLASKCLDGTVDATNFHNMTDEEIREHLVAVKGIGVWTADMFLMFTLQRPDVLPVGDLGIQKGVQKILKLKNLPTPKELEKIGERWKPYRTVASYYLWGCLD